jgi:uncharacterized membrane protein YdjX (TVP38/TMEM64 family)
MIMAANDLTFEFQGPWAVVIGILMTALALFLAYRTARRHRDRNHRE